MERFLANGRIVDLILVFVVVEAVALIAYRRVAKRGLRPLGIILMLLPGVCLLLALRVALVSGPTLAVAAWLAAALLAHLADVWQRTRTTARQ